MDKLRIILEWNSYPIWLYRNGDCFGAIDLDSVPLYSKGDDIDLMAKRIQDIYNSLFVNNSREFTFVGFTSEKMKEEFINLFKLFKSKVVERFSKYYEIIILNSGIERFLDK